MKKLFILFLSALIVFCGCSADGSSTHISDDPEPEDLPSEFMDAPSPETESLPGRAALLVYRMTVEELIGQMLLVRCPASDVEETLAEYQFGGLVLFAQDTRNETPESLTAKLESYQNASPIPLLISVDEEGGSVTRISSYSAFRSSRFPSPQNAHRQGGLPYLLEIEAEKSQLLASLGINVNLAPVCDVVTDPSAFLYSRSLGLNAEKTAECIAAMVETMAKNGVGSVLKHFPGYGNCADTHVGTALDDRTLEDFYKIDFLPFQAGIDAGAGGVLVCHNIVTCMDANLPASLSPEVHRILREDLKFDGVIMTDDMAMDAIADVYGEGEAAVLAVLAGNDMLCTSGYKIQYEAILEAVKEGRIPVSILQQSVVRIIQWKQNLGLI